MTYEKIFTDVRKAFIKADTEKLNREFAFQFNITGSGEGVFYVAYKNFTLDIQPYDYKDNDGVLYAVGDVFIKIANGVLSLEKAVSDGFLRIDGNAALAREIEKLVLEETAAGKKIERNGIAKALDEKSEKRIIRADSDKRIRKPASKKKAADIDKADFNALEATNLIGGFGTDFYL